MPAPRAPSLKDLNIIRGGTPSTKQTQLDQKAEADMRKRQAKLDQMRSATKQDPIGARMYESSLGGNAWIVLEIQRRDRSVWDWMECQLSSTPDAYGGIELVLQLRCPVCDLVHGRVHYPDMTIKQSNRKFTLDDRPTDKGGVAGQPWVNPNDPRHVRVLAGLVFVHERITCPVCSTGWRIGVDTDFNGGNPRNIMRRD